MTHDEVMKLTDEELRIEAAKLHDGFIRKLTEKECRERSLSYAMGCSGVDEAWLVRKDGEIIEYIGPPPDYTNNIASAWKLYHAALASDRFWDFCQNLKMSASSNDFTVVMGYLSPRLITRAFVLAFDEKNVPS